MKKSLPLLAGAVVVPLLAAVAAFAATGGGATEAPSGAADTSTSGSSTATLEAPVQLATPPQATARPQTDDVQAPAGVVLAEEPEVPTTTTTSTTVETPTTPVPPNEWKTPDPTTQPPASPISPGGPIELTIAWDGLKCPTPDAWSVPTPGGVRMMCPGSATP